MNEVELLIQEKEKSTSTAFVRFILLSDKYKEEAFYYFVEGKDAPYYQYRIKSQTEIEIIPIQCGGKSKVLEIFNLLKGRESYNKYKKGFFVDKDFDNNSLISSDIYVTPCYSIENLYTQEYTIKEILKCEFNILPSDAEYCNIIYLYRNEINQFHNCILEFTAWYSCLKSKTSETGVSLDENFPKDFIELKIGSIEKKYNLEDIENKYPDAIKVSREDIDANKITLNNDPHNSLRGKYEMQFLYAFLIFLIDDANDKSKRKYCKKKVKFNLNRSLLLSQLSQYAISPCCLKEYIKRRLTL